MCIRDSTGADAATDADLRSPMPGSVIAVGVADGDVVTAGTVVVIVEAMKMEHALSAPVDGRVDLSAAVGDQVGVGELLARVIPTDTAPSADIETSTGTTPGGSA